MAAKAKAGSSARAKAKAGAEKAKAKAKSSTQKARAKVTTGAAKAKAEAKRSAQKAKAKVKAGAEQARAKAKGSAEQARSLIDRELDRLRRLRDELNVQAHLGRAEVRELWEKAEHRWHELEAEAGRLRREAREPLQAIGEAGQRLVEELETGYERIRKLLK